MAHCFCSVVSSTKTAPRILMMTGRDMLHIALCCQLHEQMGARGDWHVGGT